MPGQHGGSRPGSGSKAKADKHKGAIEGAEKRIADRLPWLIDKALELAEGVEVQKTLPNGQTKVYSQPPCIKSITYLVDRVMGKPVQALEHSGPDGGAVPFNLTLLPGGDLDALERIARQLALGGPDGGPPGDRG